MMKSLRELVNFFFILLFFFWSSILYKYKFILRNFIFNPDYLFIQNYKRYFYKKYKDIFGKN